MKKVLVLILICFSLFSCEREWIVKYEDCREIIEYKDWDFFTYFRNFTCYYDKTSNWDIISWECISIKTSQNWCEKAYKYEKTPYKTCFEWQYINFDWECRCSYWVQRMNKCISYEEDCKNSFWENVEWVADENDFSQSSCYCKSWFKWDDNNEKCIKNE